MILADIGRNSVVGAGSVVTSPIPDNVIAAGVPARVIRERTVVPIPLSNSHQSTRAATEDAAGGGKRGNLLDAPDRARLLRDEDLGVRPSRLPSSPGAGADSTP